MPVLNIHERITVRRIHKLPTGDVSILRGATVHSPAQVLSTPNTSTIKNRLTKWTVLNANGAGSAVDQGGVIQDALSNRNDAWETMVWNKDNLIVNECITALEERVLLAVAAVEVIPKTTLLTMDCKCHGAVLCTKPFVRQAR